MTSPQDYPMTRTCPFGPVTPHQRLADEGPLTKIRLFDGSTVWFVTGHAEARAVLSDHRAFSSDRTDPAWPVLVPRLGDSRKAGSLVGMDPPEHTEQRRILVPGFTAKRMAAMRPEIRQITTDLLDGIVEQGPPAELIAGFTQPLTSRVLCRILGAPYDDYAFFERHTTTFLSGTSSRAEAADALAALGAYIDELIQKKQAEPGEGLLDDMLAGRTRADPGERKHLVAVAMTLLIAGYETTANTMGVGIVALLEHPEALAAALADGAVMEQAVEEVLRTASVVDAVARFATRDVEIGGHPVKAGDGVVVALAQANRDPAAFPSPQDFDVHRSARGQVSFGFGVHQCVGQNLARVELEVAFRELFGRLPSLRLAVPADRLPMKEPGAFHGVTELPVEW
jgi:pentalenic acid synthase